MRKHKSITAAMATTAWLAMAGISGAQTPAVQPATPDQIEEAIDHTWEADAQLKACKGCDLDVEVTGHVAKISGEVPTAALKARAARLAKVAGVDRVDNQIEITVPTSAADKTRGGLNKAANKTADGVETAADKTAEGVSTAADKTGDALSKTGNVLDDTWLTTKVKAQYVGKDALDGSDITVDTKNNVVTLSGSVPTAAAHAEALRIARETKGVKRVVDNLRVGPKASR